MKYRKFSFTVLFAILSIVGFGQLNIGIKLSPGVSPSRPASTTDTLSIEKEASGIRFLGGVVVDYQFKENYEFRSGINFLSKKLTYSAAGDTQGVSFEDSFIVQYVQIPLTIVLNTDEIALDKKIYFQLGTSIDIKVKDDLTASDNPLTTKLGFIDTSMIVAAGLDMKLGTKTRAFGGLVFQRGFINQAWETVNLKEKFTLQSGFIGIEAGIIF